MITQESEEVVSMPLPDIAVDAFVFAGGIDDPSSSCMRWLSAPSDIQMDPQDTPNKSLRSKITQSKESDTRTFLDGAGDSASINEHLIIRLMKERQTSHFA
jgi:hypothetical protein